ncbi:hypothetical protein [Nonomuraea sp. CA-141351]|uniref:hypothetical protein n=1 Tax=Nonomuraea sp. CA-141351 TaxID=3239996 RepID=UPI003D902898
MTTRQCKQARRRPVVLFGALLAPAILAGGLLAGEMRGFEQGVGGPVVMGDGVGRVGFGPVLMRAPAHPERLYEGSVPEPVRVVSRPRVADAPQAVATDEPSYEEPVTPAPERTQVGECPGEWANTWLWDMCLERERQTAGAKMEIEVPDL